MPQYLSNLLDSLSWNTPLPDDKPVQFREGDVTPPNDSKASSSSLTTKEQSCYGRLKDLEIMVPSQWWKTVFADAMYLKTDGDVIEDPEITKEEITLLEADMSIKQILERGNRESAKVSNQQEPGNFVFSVIIPVYQP
jgi:hypothetical protein